MRQIFRPKRRSVQRTVEKAIYKQDIALKSLKVINPEAVEFEKQLNYEQKLYFLARKYMKHCTYLRGVVALGGKKLPTRDQVMCVLRSVAKVKKQLGEI